MDKRISSWCFTLFALASWRFASLLAEEDDPRNLAVGFPIRAGATFLGRALGRLMDWFCCPRAVLQFVCGILNVEQGGFFLMKKPLSRCAFALQQLENSYRLWFSLPLSIWVSTGWIGLFLHWQVLPGVVGLLEKLTRKQELVLQGGGTSEPSAEPCEASRCR